MRLNAGTRVGPYQILGLAGVGGMGEVYRARDQKLQRDVAIKILPEAFATDPERRARFEREAQTLASLNHANIGAIYGFVPAEDFATAPGETPRPAIVLELVDGPTLADRIGQGPLPIEEALPIARQMADALEAAHQRGIIHRDLKPANIKLRSDGVVKVLDFGLAKALTDDDRTAGSGSGATTDQDRVPTRSPTLLSPAATAPGVILGTAAYMSPEQARGRTVDQRSDIWAFGGVLFEMLAGRRAFAGDDIAATLASVIAREPDWSLLPAGLPSEIQRLLRRCLEKDPNHRLHDIADARLEIDDAMDAPTPLPQRSAPPVRHGWPILAAAALACAALGGAAALVLLPRPSSSPAVDGTGPVTQAVLELPASAPLALGVHVPSIGFDSPAIALSADGRRLAYIGQSESGTQVYLRELASSSTTAIAGTDGAIYAFFSPDGRSLGFLTEDKVKTVELDGGAPVTLCDAVQPVTATWATDDTIFFSEQQGIALARVPARGGAKTALRPLPARLFPKVTPDGAWALGTHKNGASTDYADLVSFPTDSGDLDVLVRGGYDGRYVAPGFLVFARAGSLFAARFDSAQRKVLGDPTRIASGVAMDFLIGQAHYDVSANGVLAYVPGAEQAADRLAWVDRDGRTEYLDAPARRYGAVDLSQDGRRLAVHVADVTDYVWLYDFDRHEGRRVTTGPAGWPILDADGSRVAFTAWQSYDRPALMWQQVDGGSPQELSPEQPGSATPAAWSPDGQVLATSRGFFAGKTALTRVTDSDGYGTMMQFSPDGRWVAYRAELAGQFNIFIRSYPDGGVNRQFSVNGGVEPLWCADGELFYRTGNLWLSSVVRTTPQLAWDPPRPAFQTDFVDTDGRSYDVSPDGQRLLVVKRAAPERDRIHVITNWTSRLATGSPMQESQ